MNRGKWETHYRDRKSFLVYPDENLVRLLQKNYTEDATKNALAVDLGCGSGRHLKLLGNAGMGQIIGTDSSFNALNLCRENYNYSLIQCGNKNIPLKNRSADLVIAWGSLHYCCKDDLPLMIDEIIRILKYKGKLFATLRSNRDTCLKKGKHLGNNTWETNLNDLKGSIVSFYDEDELKANFSRFGSFRYGIMERSIVGNIDKRISHWVISAQK